MKEANMHNKEEIFEKAIALLKKDRYIIFTNLLYPHLGVSETWWYDNIMSDKAKSETIRDLMAANMGKNTTDALRKLKAKKDTPAITAFLKINNRNIRKALNTVREEIVEVPYNEDMEREDLLNRLDELENE